MLSIRTKDGIFTNKSEQHLLINIDKNNGNRDDNESGKFEK